MNSATSTSQASRARKTPFVPQASEWVNLRDAMPAYGYHQALLLCEHEDGQWSVWVPDHGETVMRREQFIALAD